MADNHLLVYNPVAPTEEFLGMLDGLGHDGVSHILLGATTYEHKIFVGPFARRFPSRQGVGDGPTSGRGLCRSPRLLSASTLRAAAAAS